MNVSLPEGGFQQMAFGSPVLTDADRSTLLKIKTIIDNEIDEYYAPPEPGFTINVTQSIFNFQITWTPVPGAQRYLIYRGTSSTFSDAELIGTIVEQLTPGNRVYTDTSNQLDPITYPTIYYFVRAVDDSDEGPIAGDSVSNEAASVTVGDIVVTNDLEVQGQITALLVESFSNFPLVVRGRTDVGTGAEIAMQFNTEDAATGFIVVGDNDLSATYIQMDADGIVLLGSSNHLYFQSKTSSHARIRNNGTQLIFERADGGAAAEMLFGNHSAIGAETVTGYITVKDYAGNTRKLAVVS